jgi:hypothetical protein
MKSRASFLGGLGSAPQHPLTDLGISSVEGADADGEHDVVRLFFGLQDEVFHRHPAEAHAAGPDLVYCGGACLDDGSGRAVDAQDVTGVESGGDGPGGREASSSTAPADSRSA